MDYIKYLRAWIGFVGLTALGNTVQCYIDNSFVSERLYTATPHLVNPLMARLFGAWTGLAAILRLYCSIYIHNRQIYNLTLISFLLACGHFVSEVFFYKTAFLTAGTTAPLVVSSLSIILMVIGYRFLDAEDMPTISEPEEIIRKMNSTQKGKKAKKDD